MSGKNRLQLCPFLWGRGAGRRPVAGLPICMPGGHCGAEAARRAGCRGGFHREVGRIFAKQSLKEFRGQEAVGLRAQVAGGGLQGVGRGAPAGGQECGALGGRGKKILCQGEQVDERHAGFRSDGGGGFGIEFAAGVEGERFGGFIGGFDGHRSAHHHAQRRFAGPLQGGGLFEQRRQFCAKGGQARLGCKGLSAAVKNQQHVRVGCLEPLFAGGRGAAALGGIAGKSEVAHEELVVGIADVQQGFEVAVLKEGVRGGVAENDDAVVGAQLQGRGGCVARGGIEKRCGGKESGTPENGKGTHRGAMGST